MSPRDELVQILTEAQANLGMAVALAALRKTENGASGREFGVLSVHAPTFVDQCHVARRSFELAVLREIGLVATDIEGFYTDEFLTAFSHHWAPIGAENDPQNLNANHARNLIRFHGDFRGIITQAWVTLWTPGTVSV